MTGRSIVHSNPIKCVCVCVSLSLITCNSNPLQLQRVGRRGQTEKNYSMLIYFNGRHVNMVYQPIKKSTFIWKILLTNLLSVIRFVFEIPGRDVTSLEIKTSFWGKSDPSADFNSSFTLLGC